MIKTKVIRVCYPLDSVHGEIRLQQEIEQQSNAFLRNVTKVKKVIQTESMNDKQACVTLTFFYE